MVDERESLSPVPNYNTSVKDLTYQDLLTSNFTLVSHERGLEVQAEIHTWRVTNIGKTQTDVGWRLYRHSFGSRCSR
jgi:hypothetical protein